MGQLVRELGDATCVVERNAELVTTLPRADVLVRRLDRDLRIHANRHRRADTPAPGDLVDEEELALGFDVQQEDAGIERLLQLALRLPYSAKDDVAALEAREHRAMELTTGD